MSSEVVVASSKKKTRGIVKCELEKMQVSDKIFRIVKDNYSGYLIESKWFAALGGAFSGGIIAVIVGGVFFPEVIIAGTVISFFAGSVIVPTIASYFLCNSSEKSRRYALNWSIVETVSSNKHRVPDLMGAYALFIEAIADGMKNASYDNFLTSGRVDEMKSKFLKSKKAVSKKPTVASIDPKAEFSVKVSNEILKAIESEWFETQSDIVQLLKYPLLADMREPLVQDFHVQLTYTKSIQQNSGESFSLAVAKLKMNWELVKSEAKRISLSKFSDGERKNILLAMNLMKISLNEASSVFERKQAYVKAMKYLDGLISMPESTILIIEQGLGLQELTS